MDLIRLTYVNSEIVQYYMIIVKLDLNCSNFYIHTIGQILKLIFLGRDIVKICIFGKVKKMSYWKIG